MLARIATHKKTSIYCDLDEELKKLGKILNHKLVLLSEAKRTAGSRIAIRAAIRVAQPVNFNSAITLRRDFPCVLL